MLILMGSVLTDMGRMSRWYAVVAAGSQGSPSPWDSKQFLPFIHISKTATKL